MERDFCRTVIVRGGSIYPLLIEKKDYNGIGLMNPSIFIDGTDIYLNIRNINYILYHSENNQLFNNRYGPLVYMNPENDLHLKTINYMCKLDSELHISEYSIVDTSFLDSKNPLWEFHGLEDARIVKWNGKLYISGVRRDTTPNGVGRMELSEIQISFDRKAKEIKRIRLEPPGEPTYCEKNWMPIVDMSYHYVKWCNPTQVVSADINTGETKTVFLEEETIPYYSDFRGGSQVIPYKDYRIACIHEVDLSKNRLGQKDGGYLHRFLIWNNKWKLVHITEAFSFLHGEIEFCCGMAHYKNEMLVTFGFQDNVAYLLRIPEEYFDEFINLSLINKKERLIFGKLDNNKKFKTDLIKEVLNKNIYEKFCEVKEGDIVVDIGASIGIFTYNIMEKNPSCVYCIEPEKELFEIMNKNIGSFPNIVLINKGIADIDGEKEFDLLLDPKEDITKCWKNEILQSMRFSTFIKEYGIKKIDFLKTDCEGGEYDIFNDENFEWIMKNVKYIVAEFHALNNLQKEKFKEFKNKYLPAFNDYEIYSYGMVDLKDKINNIKFINEYGYFMIYIKNEHYE